MSMYWPPRRWRIVRSIRSHYGLPCLPGACWRTGQWGSGCPCTPRYRACGHTKYEGCAPCAHDDAVAAIEALR